MTGMKCENYSQKCSYLQKYNIHYPEKIFRVLFVQDTFSKQPFVNSVIAMVAGINKRNIE